MTAANQRANVQVAAKALAPIALDHELVITHGNGPQVGLLALQGAAYHPDDVFPLDVLGAETEGLIGYLIEQELGNLLPFDKPLATLLTMVEVDPDDPAFGDPDKFVGPVYEEADARALAKQKGWVVKPDGDHWRRVVPSPAPRRIFELRPVRWLLEQGAVVIAAGGGGIPTMYLPGTRTLVGVEAVVDKDLATALLASEIDADQFIVATDADAVYRTGARRSASHPTRPASVSWSRSASLLDRWDRRSRLRVTLSERPAKVARVGALDDLAALLAGASGTEVVP